jgi:CheY-like chemotaxis protein
MKLREGDPLSHNIEEVISSAERGAVLTQSLLAFSRKQILDPQPVNVNTIIDRVSRLLMRLIGEDVKLETKLTDDDLTIIADSGQIEQVLMNLATNARDAMPDGGYLTIETRRVALGNHFVSEHDFGKAGEYALFMMSDTGKGMDAKTVSRVFEPFFTTKEMGKGTGLGLSIVYGIVKQHNGYINVYSEPGRGTTFKIYLPLATLSSEEKKKSLPPVPQSITSGNEMVLVAEDDSNLRSLVRSVLEEFGYTVVEAVDGDDALAKIRENRDEIKLLLLDVIMPKKNGKDVYEEAKKIIPGIRALFTSGYTADMICKKGILDDGVNFISKPVSPTELLKKVREVLDKVELV